MNYFGKHTGAKYMNELSKEQNLPVLYGMFIIGALLPQIFNINGGMIDAIWKIVIVGGFFLLQLKNRMFFLSKKSLFFIFCLTLSQLSTGLINQLNPLSLFAKVFMICILYIYFYEIPLKSVKIYQKDIFRFYKMYVWFIVIACTYNMIMHPTLILHISSAAVYSDEAVSSFFDNKNSFGVFLLFGCIASTILNITTKKRKWLFISWLFILNELMAFCRTAAVLSVAMVIVSILIGKNKNDFIKNIIIFFIVLTIGILFVFYNSTINNYLFNVLFSSTTSLDVRENYVSSMIGLLNGEHLFFGYGAENSSLLAVQYAGNKYFHNTYLKMAIEGGIVYTSIFIAIIFMTIVNALKIMIKNQVIGAFCLLSIMIYIVYSYVEAVVLFDTPVICMVATIFSISIPLLFKNALNNESYGNNRFDKKGNTNETDAD